MLETLVSHAQTLPNYDVDHWKPDLISDIGLKILADGVWMHQGQPITKAKIMQLFGRLLRRQTNGDYWLVTPTEAFVVEVEDLPFIAVAADLLDQKNGHETLPAWRFTSNCGDLVWLDQNLQLRVTTDKNGQPKPEIELRAGLWARINRNVFYQLALACECVDIQGESRAQLTSANFTYDLGAV